MNFFQNLRLFILTDPDQPVGLLLNPVFVLPFRSRSNSRTTFETCVCSSLQIQINRSDYFQNLLNLNVFEKEDWTRRLVGGEDRSRWVYNAYDTSMTFYNSWNQLLVPAGMLQFPVYEWSLPHYFNFGAMGGLIGHYIVHSIDNWGGCA